MEAQRGSPRAASYFHISDNLYIKFDNNDKKGNLGNQWQSLISSLSTFYETFQTPISQLKSKWGVLTYFEDSKPKIGIFGQFETNSIRVFQK